MLLVGGIFLEPSDLVDRSTEARGALGDRLRSPRPRGARRLRRGLPGHLGGAAGGGQGGAGRVAMARVGAWRSEEKRGDP